MPWEGASPAWVPRSTARPPSPRARRWRAGLLPVPFAAPAVPSAAAARMGPPAPAQTAGGHFSCKDWSGSSNTFIMFIGPSAFVGRRKEGPASQRGNAHE
ncbi:hypothetical protein JCM13210_01120 [Thermaerobacter litoralis]